ncbi:unnamed protein product [Cyclocybe aegerita]|uniref:Secreted protein n=1 Tax=Cyclocybe aegerita TaxID=1973307 RepID=A0A8S0VTR3_CYCAE|nr:unnamed protein product [Cyclocybe aegerita]
MPRWTPAKHACSFCLLTVHVLRHLIHGLAQPEDRPLLPETLPPTPSKPQCRNPSDDIRLFLYVQDDLFTRNSERAVAGETKILDRRLLRCRYTWKSRATNEPLFMLLVE